MKHNLIDVQVYIQNAEYPATKRELKEQAFSNGASKDVLDMLEKIPERAYEGSDDVMEQAGKVTRASDEAEDGVGDDVAKNTEDDEDDATKKLLEEDDEEENTPPSPSEDDGVSIIHHVRGGFDAFSWQQRGLQY